MALCDVANVMNSRNLLAGQPFCSPDTTDWQRFYKDYLGDPSGTQFQFRPFGDGGYLDNKPFSYAIDTILARQAALPVDRKLIYIEPAPEDVSRMTFHASGPDDRPDAIQNSLKALIELPRYETIRQDLERLIEWNTNIRRMARIRQDIRRILEEGGEEAVNHLLDRDSLQYRAYIRLRLSSATDAVADRVSEALGIDPTSARGEAVRILAGGWRKAKFNTGELELAFLDTYDLSYVWRALHYLYQKTGEREELSRIHAALNTLMDAGLRDFIPNLPHLPPERLPDLDIVVSPEAAGPLGLPPKPPGCDELSDPWAQYVLDNRGWRKLIDALHEDLKDKIGERLAGERNNLDSVMQKHGGWRFFAAQDVLLFPVQFETNLGETGEVDILRISPADTSAIPPPSGNQPKLKGVLFGAFGGFLDKTWRYNDMLWGRLDGAERLITAVLPAGDKETVRLRNELIEEAQFEIAKEWERTFGKDLAKVAKP